MKTPAATYSPGQTVTRTGQMLIAKAETEAFSRGEKDLLR